MKISLNWIKQYVALDGVSTDDLKHAITFLGFEVEGVVSTALPPMTNVVVGAILTRAKHLPKVNKEWIEIGGCGIVDPSVFEAVGYDPEVWTGYAFGMGLERLAMLMYGIDDIRYFYQNDVRFLKQFA